MEFVLTGLNIKEVCHKSTNASKSEFKTFCQKNYQQNVEADRLIIYDQTIAKRYECKYLVLILVSNFSLKKLKILPKKFTIN